MSAITVRMMLAIILENKLQMDDEIHFNLTEETREDMNENELDIDFVRMEKVSVIGKNEKQLHMMFDLNRIEED